MKISKGTKELGTNRDTEKKKQIQRIETEIEIEIESKD
jgi:hypothetical protein